MTTPSGTISAQDVANEFGLGRPISFSSFYGKGGAPGSGPISLGDMRNRTALSLSTSAFNGVPQNGVLYSSENQQAVLQMTSGTITRISGNAGPDTGTYSGTVTFNLATQATSWRVETAGITFNIRTFRNL